MSSSGKIIQVASADIVDGTIVNADVNAAAAIAYSKLALTASIVAGDLAVTATMKKIAEIVGTGSSGVLEISSIPATYRHLRLQFVGRSDAAVATTTVRLTFETTPTAGTYNHETLLAQGATVSGVENIGTSDFITCSGVAGASSAANVVGGAVLDLLDYSNTSVFKIVGMIGVAALDLAASGIAVRNGTGLWESTAAIDRIRLTLASGNWTATSRATLYGIPG